MAIPVLKPSASWFAPTVDTLNRTNITQINFVDSYTPSGTVTDSWDASLAQDGGIMCYVEGTVLTIAGNGSGSIKANENASRMFSYASDTTTSDLFSALTTISGLTLLDTSDCTTMERMFRSCTKLTSLDISNFNTSKVKNFQMTFAVMNKLSSLDVSNLDTSACEDMGYMFYGDPFTSLNFENWDVSRVKSFDHFLTSCSSLSNFDVSNWDVSSVENFNAAFHGVSKASYDLSKWNVSKVKVFSQMFEGNTKLTELKGLENWNTSNGICFGQMFIDCSALEELNLSSFDTRKAHSGSATSSNGSTSENTNQIFNGMTSLKKITLGKNFTFLGDGTSSEIGSLPNTADGNWYTIDGTAYAIANVPNLTYATYYATAVLAQEEFEAKKYISYANLKTYHGNLMNLVDAKISECVVTTEGDGTAYTATVPGIKSLTSGVNFIMVPHVVSATTSPTLNVNGLGAKNIKRRLSSISTGVQNGYTATWLAVGKPFRLVYDGMQWIVEGLEKPAAADLYGTLSIEKGGTGATDAETALTNLGVYSKTEVDNLLANSQGGAKITYGTEDLVAGESPLANGEVYLVYE